MAASCPMCSTSALSAATLLPVLLVVFAAAVLDSNDLDSMIVDVGNIQVGDFIFNEYSVLGRLPLAPPPSILLQLNQSSVDRSSRRSSGIFQDAEDPEVEGVHIEKNLGAGSNGVAFLVNQSGNLFVMKFFHMNGKYVTFNDIVNSSSMSKSISKSVEECDICKNLTLKAESMENMRVEPEISKGMQRTMRCHDHNVRPEGNANEALYMKLDYAGEPLQTITKRLRNTPGNLDAMLSLVKQLFEGLAFLASAGWVHHDLKIENLVSKYQTHNNVTEYALHLIDFDGAVEPSKADPQHFTTSSIIIAPKERVEGEKNFESCPGKDGSDMCPYAFDVFSAGITVFEMVCGTYFDSVFGEKLKSGRNGWNYEKLQAISEQDLIESMQSKCKGNLPEQFATKVENTTFVTLLRKTLNSSAQGRPTALEILESDVMKKVNTPDDFPMTPQV